MPVRIKYFKKENGTQRGSLSIRSWRTQCDWGYPLVVMTQIVKEYLACSWQLTADGFYLHTVFSITAADPSRSFRMTINVSLIMKPYRISSFRAEVRMLYETTGRRLCDTERRIYYPRWRLTFPSLQQQIPCWCFVWHLMEIICFGF